MNTKHIEDYLNRFGKQVANRAIANLGRKKGGKTKLAQSIKFEVVKTSTGFVVEFYMLDYGAYLDKGVSGTKKVQSYKDYENQTKTSPYAYRNAKGHSQPPTGVIDKWVVRKGIKGSRSQTGQFIKRKSLVFAIAKSIGMKGIKSLSFFQKPLGLGLKQFGGDLLNAISEDIISDISKYTTTVK